MNRNTRMAMALCFIVLFFLLGTVVCFADEFSAIEEKASEARKMEELREEADRAEREAAQEARQKAFEKAKTKLEERIVAIDLPEDTTQRFTVSRLSISGNTLVSTDQLLKDLPLIYNASDKPLEKAESTYLYDFRVLHDIILEPTEPRQVSARTIQGFTQYILSVYREKNYAGVYVYVPADVIERGEQLKEQVLPIKVLEAKVTSITIRTYDPNQNETEKGYLRRSALEKWSPVKVGQVADKKELDDFVNLLNLDPDRYVSAVVSRGAEPNSLALGYNVYEANPWHWFVQADNSGTKERQWNPRIGFINTNLRGMDDRFTAIYQGPWESGIEDNYGLYGSYDFPVAGPRLRLNLYGGYSEFDIHSETTVFDFLGRGTFYGGILRYNLKQFDDWFLDVKGSLEHVRSKVNTEFFAQTVQQSNVEFFLAGLGVDLHRSDDLSDSFISLDMYKSLGGESDQDEFNLARLNSDSLFTIYNISASHSQYMDENKVNRLTSTLRWIGSDERLVPAKMTSFGGMYTVRGYEEYEIIADGGMLGSIQYEHDLVAEAELAESYETASEQKSGEKPFLRKLAPLVFFDYGRSTIRDPIGTEDKHEELMSAGAGVVLELGEHLRGVFYYGYPFVATDDTSKGKGRINFGLLVRW